METRSRENLVRALNCRLTVNYGMECKSCPYGRKLGNRWACDIARLCQSALDALKADTDEINNLAHIANDYRVRLMTLEVTIK